MRQVILGFLFVALLAGVAAAQSPYRDAEAPTTTDMLRQPTISNGFNGLLDPSRISMDHQLGMGYMSMGGQGFTQGYYMNTLSYRFDAPVLLRVHTGVTNNPFSSGSSAQPGQSGIASMMQDAQFFGGADLLWKPSERTSIFLSVSRAPASIYGYGSPMRRSYGMHGWGRSPWGGGDPFFRDPFYRTVYPD